MNNEYFIKYKHINSWFWKKIKVSGHSYNKELDKIVLFHSDGSMNEIPQWSKCFVVLGLDFLNAQKKQMEKETGANINLNV